MLPGLLDVSRRRKRRWALIKISSWTLLVILSAAAGISFFYIPSLRVGAISFQGLESLNEAALAQEISGILSRKYFWLFPKNNVVFLPREEISALLERTLRIGEFAIKTSLPSKLEIQIKERKPWAVWCREEGETISACALSDKNGFVFAAAPIFSGSAVLKILDQRGRDYFGENFMEPEKFHEINSFAERLEKRLGEEVFAMELKDNGEFRLVLKSGWYAILDFETDLGRAFDNLVLSLDNLGNSGQKLEYVDLRFPDKVFYRLKN
ncbi:hypothetical protein HY406_00185 [Candidatus Giovannonibacteria bacterium]|nr:hypothetical protein [Candidatus Giovannonibacteria bacterium]